MKTSKILTPLGWCYGIVGKLRAAFYHRGLIESFEFGVKTVSVGNITVGGTGKTPLVAFIADLLAKRGDKVCILTRGYGRDNPKERVVVSDGERILADAREAGDEPFELAKKLCGKAAIIADANRAEAGIWAKQEFGTTAFILDDGFQHLRVKRNLDLVLLDASNPFGNGKLLPAGILRESKESLQRADAIVITRANLVENISELIAEISLIAPNLPLFVSRNEFSAITRLKDFGSEKIETVLPNVKKLRSFAFCALGNPNNFYRQLKAEGFAFSGEKSFPDHHIYTQSELKKLEAEAIETGAEALLTTAKDAVKLRHLKFNLPCYVIENGLTFDDEPAFLELILKA